MKHLLGYIFACIAFVGGIVMIGGLLMAAIYTLQNPEMAKASVMAMSLGFITCIGGLLVFAEIDMIN